MHAAAANNSEPAVIDLLLDRGADVTAQNNFGATPLQQAMSFNGALEVAPALFEREPNIVALGATAGILPLHYSAAYLNAPDVIAALLQRGADIQSTDADGWTPLHFAAAFNGQTEIMKVLLDGGADTSARDIDGMTPLHVAARKTQEPDIVATLIDRGADIASEATVGFFQSGVTPLHCAAGENGAPSVIAQLLDRGAHVAARDSNGRDTSSLGG